MFCTQWKRNKVGGSKSERSKSCEHGTGLAQYQDGDERTLGVTGGRVEQHCRTDFCVPKTSRGNPLVGTRKRDFLKFLRAERNAVFRESVAGLVASLLPRIPMYAKSTDVTLRKDGPY